MRRLAAAFLLAALALSGCVMMPPAPYGRALLGGQNEAQSGMNIAYRPDILRKTYERSGSSTIVSERQPEHFAVWPIYWYVGGSHGLGTAGTEWGWQMTLLSLEPAIYLRQALRRPIDPWATAWALQFDGVYGLPDYYSVSAALAGTKRLGKSWEGTLALRGGATCYPLLGPSGGWGPSYDGKATLNFVDASLALGHLDPDGRISIEAVARLPLSASQRLYDNRDTIPYPPYDVTHDVAELFFGPSFFLALHASLAEFTTYVGQALALPRRWTPRPSPDQMTAEQHLRFAAELAAADMPADAADEYQTALRLDPDLDKAHAPLSEQYMKLGEWELAQYHAERSVQIDPTDKRAAEVLRRINVVLEARR